MSKITDDLRIDPKIRKYFGSVPDPINQGDIGNRAQLLDEASSPEAVAFRKQMEKQTRAVYEAGSLLNADLDDRTLEFESSPDGNIVKVRLLRPNNGATLMLN